VLPVAGIVATTISALLLLRALPEQPVHAVQVQVDGLYMEWGHCRQSTAIVYHTTDGRRGQDWRPSAAIDCRSGDWIPAEEVGANVRLTPGSCRKAGPIIGSRAC
jgi:hypothetical protein